MADSLTLDTLDRKLVHALQLDGRAPLSRIAQALGVSEHTVSRRYRRLHAGGLKVVGQVASSRVGYTDWFLRLRCGPDAAVPIANALARREDTFFVKLTSGGTELVCVSRTRSDDERDTLLLQRLPHTPRIVSVSAHCLLHIFYGGPRSWFAKLEILSADEADALRPPPTAAPDGDLRLDPADEVLLAELAGDGRAAYGALAAATGRTEAGVKRRITELRAAGALYFDVQFESEFLGYGLQAMLWLTVAPANLDTVGTALGAHREIAFAAATTGPSNLVAVVVCQSTSHLYEYLSTRIGAQAGVEKVETAPVIRQVKQLAYRIGG
jgi:DNA-binding Lrp family transcriptional regulator